MVEPVNDFSITFAKASVTDTVFTGLLDIVSASGQVINYAELANFDQASNTKGGTLIPSSQQLIGRKQLEFTILRNSSETESIEHFFLGSANINGFRVPITFTVTIPPVVVTVTDISVDKDYFTTDCSVGITGGDTTGVKGFKPIVYTASYYKDYEVLENTPSNGISRIKVATENVPEKNPYYFLSGIVEVTFDNLLVTKNFSKQILPSEVWNQFPEPLIPYAVKNMWGHRERDSQYQLKLSRISSQLGFVNDFFYMGHQYRLPAEYQFYHVFSMGGLDINFWNMGETRKGWYPFNTWIRASTISKERGVAIDVYNANGKIFPRNQTLVLQTFQGVTLIAFPVTQAYPMPLDKNVYLRCYSTDINTSIISSENIDKYSFGYEFAEYSQSSDFTKVKNAYTKFLNYGIGRVIFFVNGIVTDISGYVPIPGDYLEVYYDPSVKKVNKYKYTNLSAFYSSLDSKKKLILFPGNLNQPRMYEYFDDCDFYIHNTRTKQSLYYHRNNINAVRQLTHQDFSIHSDYVNYLVNQLISIDTTKASTESDMEIHVVYRDTQWKFKLGPTTSRINDLYLLEDPEKILLAMTGIHNTIPEWSANELEKSATNIVLNSIYQELDTLKIREALGYNGCAMALSESLLYMPHITPGDPDFDDSYPTPTYDSGMGYRVPASYVESSTAYEYNKDGLLIRNSYLQNLEWFTPGPDAYFVEFVVGKASSWLDYKISRQDVVIKEGYGFRVYKAGWLVDPDDETLPNKNLFLNEYEISGDGNQRYPEPTEVRIYADGETVDPNPPIQSNGRPDGKWVDITDTNEYRIVNGTVAWNFDTNNHVGMVVFDTTHLYNEFDLTHIDNSIWFTVTHSWECGGLPLTIEPAQIDVWCNNHPLIENVDYKVDFPRIYIISKMWLDPSGKNHFAYRARGLSPEGIIPSSELGFVQDGVIGFNGRYNLRVDRPTKTVINGRIYLTNYVDWAEDIHHKHNLALLNGFPYEVKHIYCGNKYVEKNDLYWNFKEARELDKKVSAYLTEHVKYKPNIPLDYPYMEKDRYRLYSPFMSQLVNEMVLGFLNIPLPDGSPIGYSDQAIDDLTRSYQWLLKYDPIVNEMDDRFFSFQPYSNLAPVTVTPNQLTVLSRVNQLYLKNKIPLEGFFEVKHNV